MQTLFMRILDILFPPSEDMLRVRTLTHSHMERLYRQCVHRGAIALSEFSDPSIRALIHETKFHGSERAAALLAFLVDRFLQEASHTYDMVIPIPLSSSRQRKRGYNQAEEVLRRASPHETMHIAQNVLARTRDTRPQTDLDKHGRQKNLRGAFAVKDPSRITGKRILLVDDVTTTGATFHEAKAVLMRHKPASVTCLAIAH